MIDRMAGVAGGAGPSPVQSCLFGHTRAEVVYECR